MARDDAFELVAATVEHFRDSGFRYLVVEASKQWTGAACGCMFYLFRLVLNDRPRTDDSGC